MLNEHLQTAALADKAKIIKLQTDLLNCKDKQLESLHSAVETTVQTTMKKEIKQYSDVVKMQSQPSPTLTSQSLKKVVKSALVEDDRSKNLMVFGLKEEETEILDDKVTELFSQLGEKPRVAASRVGLPRTDGHSRPVKVSVSSPTIAQQILLKCKRLKESVKFRLVYVCPDRSPEERAVRKQLVLDLRSAVKQHPHKHHFIRGGKVCNSEKTT